MLTWLDGPDTAEGVSPTLKQSPVPISYNPGAISAALRPEDQAWILLQKTRNHGDQLSCPKESLWVWECRPQFPPGFAFMWSFRIMQPNYNRATLLFLKDFCNKEKLHDSSVQNLKGKYRSLQVSWGRGNYTAHQKILKAPLEYLFLSSKSFSWWEYFCVCPPGLLLVFSQPS